MIKNKIKSMYKTSLIFSIVLFIIGLFLLIKPEATLDTISYIIGILLMIWGVIPVITFISNKDNNNYLETSFIIGIFAVIFGIIVMLNPKFIVSIIPFVIGIWMIINGITKLTYSINLNKETDAMNSIIISAIILVCGIVLVFNPFAGAKVLTQIIGIFIIIYSVLDIIECHTLKKNVKQISKKVKKEDNIIEAVYEEKK